MNKSRRVGYVVKLSVTSCVGGLGNKRFTSTNRDVIELLRDRYLWRY